jgi:hypothetical protein
MNWKIKKRYSAVGVLLCLASLTVLANPDATEPEPITDVLCLRKMSLDLTNRGPTEAEVADLESGNLSLDQLADSYLASAEFEQVAFNWYRSQFPPTELSEAIVGLDVEEPSRIARYIVTEDLDYRLLLTADFSISPDGVMTPAQNGPSAGILGTQHYMSAFAGSFRRNWAGHFLKEWTPIVLQAVTLPDDDDTDLTPDSLMTNPLCSGCHASEIYGIDYLAPFALCYGDDGLHQSDCTEPGGKFLTEDGGDLANLGTIVSDSNEFMATSVNFFFKKLFGRSMAYEEQLFYVEQVTAFRESGYKAKSLIKSLVTSDEYCAR